ncbi:MAG: PPOX class F420-dependent oxidoreductase [Kutzneria sp.]|nr:PPOX class F420-dependent oxidoreductase [Kutzneria sp.]MBV9844866.1 PPOX class F420-dependent oxidoreductase [Kutzneria sp.]
MAHSDTSDGWWLEFITALPAKTAKLAVTRKDGSPHIAPVWVDVDDGELVFMTGEHSVKGRSLLRDGRVSLCFDDERPPFSFVIVAGRARIDRDPEALRYWAGRIGARYMGADRAEEFAQRNGAPGELLVRVGDATVVAQRDIAG